MRALLTQCERLVLFIGLLVSLGSVACSKQKESVIFGQRTVEIGDRKIQVEMAWTPAQREYGLKHRSFLPPDQGMLFVFPGNVKHPFWMKDTLIPLSIAFLDQNGLIIDIQEIKQLNTTKLYYSPASYRYALEMNEGWFRKNGVEIGDKLTIH